MANIMNSDTNNINMIKPLINDFDLDVVDEALINPEKSEYVDHFGFTVQVKTDNEYDSSDSENSSTKLDDTTATSLNSSINIPKQTEESSTSYYDLLLSKLTRSNPNNNLKQKKLKEETSYNLELLKEQSSKGDLDWEFWASVVNDFEKVNRTDHAKFRLMLSIGVPSQLRGKLWRIFSNSETDSDVIEAEYKELLNKSSPHEKLIKRDLSRTFPTLDYFKEKDGEGQEMLFHVIKAYSLFDETVGYCQGLHFVVGCLLLNMPDEAAFCVLLKLMGNYGLRGHFTPQMETLHERMFQFNQLLQMYLPQVHRHLDAQGVLPSMYASQWFMTLFAYRCPLELVYRVFDLVFIEGSQVIINFALALMKKNQQMILSLEFESLLEFFSGNIFNAYKDNAYEFIQDAYSFDISAKTLSKLSKQYQQEAAKEAKIQSIEDGIKKENLELQSQLKKIKHSYKTLELEHQEVANQVIESKMCMAKLDSENQVLKHELGMMRQEMEQIKTKGTQSPEYKDLMKKNAELIGRNSHLEDRLSELETILIDMKLRYAESENEYEVMKQKLNEAQRLIMDQNKK